MLSSKTDIEVQGYEFVLSLLISATITSKLRKQRLSRIETNTRPSLDTFNANSRCTHSQRQLQLKAVIGSHLQYQVNVS
jgi:hypothetical protein